VTALGRPRRALGKLAALFIAATAPACAEGPIVAPLRYEPILLAPEEPFRARVPDASPVVPAVSLPWRVTTLANGLHVVHLERHALPIVSVHLVIERGVADVSASIDAYAILEDMLEAGTQDRSQDQLSAAYASLGAAQGHG
jgi:zinc protease